MTNPMSSARANAGFITALSPKTPAPAVATSPKPSQRSLRSNICDLPDLWAESSGQVAAPAARVFNVCFTPLAAGCLRNPQVFLRENSVGARDAHRVDPRCQSNEAREAGGLEPSGYTP